MLSSVLRQAARRSFALPTIAFSRICLHNARLSQRVLPITAQRHQRWLSTPPPLVNESNLPMEKYHALSDSTMDNLLESLENLLDELGNPDYEVEYHSGVLTLRLGEQGTYVINKQPPNKQIWLSSPFSGPKRYDYSETNDDWLYSRDGRAMGDLLNNELTKALGRDIDLCLTNVSQFL